jgi:hypothetical protein
VHGSGRSGGLGEDLRRSIWEPRERPASIGEGGAAAPVPHPRREIADHTRIDSASWDVPVDPLVSPLDGPLEPSHLADIARMPMPPVLDEEPWEPPLSTPGPMPTMPDLTDVGPLPTRVPGRPDVPEVPLPEGAMVDGTVWLPRLLAELGLASSNAEARRLVEQGAVKVDGQAIADPNREFAPEELVGKVLQKGRREFVRIVRFA